MASPLPYSWSAEANDKSCGLKIISRILAGLLVADEIVADLLTFNEFAHAGAFNR
jgi:hypothetical protein